VSGAICGGGVLWAPYTFGCLWCAEPREGIGREVFSGYGSDMICGWCGTWYQDLEMRSWDMPERERDRNREKVAQVLGRRIDPPPHGGAT
jgi:hypothetical protein